MGNTIFTEAKTATQINEIAVTPYVKNYSQESKEYLTKLLIDREGLENVQVLKFTQSLCPGCVDEEKFENMKINSVVYVKSNKVWQMKECQEHGITKELYWDDYEMYKKAEKFQDPGIKILNPNIDKDQFQIDCPSDCGLCVEHESHTGLGNIAVTNRCDLTCWYCFFYSKEGEPIYEPTMDQIKFMLQRMRDVKPVGANSVQFSLDGEEKIFVKSPEGKVFHTKIGEFVDKALAKGFQTFKEPIEHERSNLEGWEALTVDENYKTTFKPLSAVIRHKNKEKLFKLKTENGWDITTTGSHSVFVLENDEIVAKPVKDIKENNILLGCLDVPQTENIKETNLLDLIKERTPEKLNKIMVTGFSKEDLKEYEALEKRWIGWDAVKYSSFEKIKKGNKIKYFNSQKELPINISITPELCRLLGYYVGEGCTYKSGIIFSFGLKDEIIDDFLYCIKSVFGETPIRKKINHQSAVQFYLESYLYKLFFEVLGCGKRAIEKQVPWIIFNVEENLKKDFLKAYLKCDGNIKTRKTGYEINHNTVSRQLASDIVLIHLQLGIVSKIEESISKPHLIKKTGQFLSKESRKFRIVINSKKDLEKSLWYLDNELKEKFKKYAESFETHSSSHSRYPITEGVKNLSSVKSADSRISYLLKRIQHDKSISKQNLEELTDFFNQNNLDFKKSLNHLSHSDIGFFKIKKIEKVEPSSEYVYDISVPGSHAFFAGLGSLLAHNTGGEPTLRDDLPEIVKAAKEIGYKHVQLNTNGINLCHKPELAKTLRAAGVSNLYLSFDGMTPQANPKNYWEAQGALENCYKAGIGVVLVPTLIGGINDHELGDIIRFGEQNIHVVRSVNFQPVSLVGRMPEKLRMKQRITIPGAIKRVEAQTDGDIAKEDWFPVPCAKQITDFIEAIKQEPKYRLSIHFACGMASYVFKDKDKNKLVPISRFFDIEGFFDYLGELTKELNSSNHRTITKYWVLAKLMKNLGKYVDKEQKPKNLKFAKILSGAVGGGNYHGLADFHHNSLFIGMMHFQDPYNWDLDRIHKCDIHYATPDGKIVPFCTFNVIPEMYRDKIQRKFSVPASQWEQQTGKKLQDDKHHRKFTPEEMKAIVANFNKCRKTLTKPQIEPDWSYAEMEHEEGLKAGHSNHARAKDDLIAITSLLTGASKFGVSQSKHPTTENPAGICCKSGMSENRDDITEESGQTHGGCGCGCGGK